MECLNSCRGSCRSSLRAAKDRAARAAPCADDSRFASDQAWEVSFRRHRRVGMFLRQYHCCPNYRPNRNNLADCNQCYPTVIDRKLADRKLADRKLADPNYPTAIDRKLADPNYPTAIDPADSIDPTELDPGSIDRPKLDPDWPSPCWDRNYRCSRNRSWRKDPGSAPSNRYHQQPATAQQFLDRIATCNS